MIVFERPKALADVKLHYCPGCTHGIIHRLVAEAIDELGIEGRTIGIAPQQCRFHSFGFQCPHPFPYFIPPRAGKDKS